MYKNLPRTEFRFRNMAYRAPFLADQRILQDVRHEEAPHWHRPENVTLQLQDILWGAGPFSGGLFS